MAVFSPERTVQRRNASQRYHLSEKCKSVTVDEIIYRDSNMWTILPNYCINISINDVKLIGF